MIITLDMYLERISREENCDNCFFKVYEICAGGFVSDSAGNPVEPYCCNISEKEREMPFKDFCYKTMNWKRQREDYYEKKEQEEYLKQIKKEQAKKRRQENYIYCFEENYLIKSLNKKIKNIKKSIHSSRRMIGLGEALSFTNEIFNVEDDRLLKERKQYWKDVEDKYFKQIEELEKTIKEVKKLRRNKLKLRDSKKQSEVENGN